MDLLPEDRNSHSFSLKLGKILEARASGWGIAGIVAVTVVIGIIYLALVGTGHLGLS